MARPSEQRTAPEMERASAADRAAMVASFCEAFADDPGLSWIWPERDDRLRRLPHFFKPIVSGAMANGVALRSAGAVAVSLWRTPGRIHPGGIEILRGLPSMVRAMGGGRERALRISAMLKAKQPNDFPWWYLQFIGVRPAAQRTGLGGMAIRAGLALGRTAAMPVYVEVMNPLNVGYYRHIGFETITEFDIGDGGPHVWAMIWRG